MSITIAIANPKGGVGKSLTTMMLADGLALSYGARVLVVDLDPQAGVTKALLGIDAAVNRRTLDGKHPEGWFPKQRITVAEAIECYTLTSAYAAAQEKDLGTLEPGKLADLVVLSRDILAAAERDQIASTEVVLTLVGGCVAFKKGK